MIHENTKVTYDTVIQSMLILVINSLRLHDTYRNINDLLPLNFFSCLLLIITVDLLSLECEISK